MQSLFQKTILIFVASLWLSLFTGGLLAASETSEVKEMAKKSIDGVIGVLKSKLAKPAKKKKILEIVEPLFDFRIMAKYSLGLKYWKKMKKSQRKEFVALFVERLKESYLDKLDLYTDEDVVVEEAAMKKKRIHVLTHLVSKDDKKEMIYKFYKGKKTGKWKVYDLEILGVSVVQTYRSQFEGVLTESSIAGLMKKLRKSGQFQIPTGEKK